MISDTQQPILVNLSAMMCAESCILTSLNYRGLDYRYFMLECWSLLYESSLILAGKNITRYDLDAVYGIQTLEVNGGIARLIEAVGNLKISIVSTLSSKLDFFPDYQITFESEGFKHQLVVVDYDHHLDAFHVLDPIANYSGKIKSADLLRASTEETGFRFLELEFPQNPKVIPVCEIFSRATMININRMGINAESVKAMRLDVRSLAMWDERKRNQWLEQNNLTIATIIKARQMVWNCYVELNVLPECNYPLLNESFHRIIGEWTSINFFLLKYKHQQQSGAKHAHTIDSKLEHVFLAEKSFIELLYALGQTAG
ncbi:hypothetical protein [Paenibacillus sp. LPE1-1-1.1]|uniref:hypothetical protein n=1 Tax=Paenibacillus sp. LPE1-1-1.1 TaxID=3135230 RepID=UPI003437C2D1